MESDKVGSEPASKVFSGGRAATCLLAVLFFFPPGVLLPLQSVRTVWVERRKEEKINSDRRYCKNLVRWYTRNLVRWYRRNLVRRYRRNLVTLRIIFLVRPGQDMMA